jgi:hypothetical protein
MEEQLDKFSKKTENITDAVSLILSGKSMEKFGKPRER